MGEWARARDIFERALGLLGDDPWSAAYSRFHLGQLDLLEGNWERGSAQVEAAMRAERPGRDLWLRWHGQRLLAERDLLDGEPAAALARLEPLVELGRRAPDPGGTQGVPAAVGGRTPRGNIMFNLLFALLARAYMELGQEDEAEAVLRESMKRARAQDHHSSRADLLRVQGMLRSRQRRFQEAREALEEAIELAQRMPDPHREAQARALLGTLAARTEEDAEAREQLRAPLAIFQRLGAHPYVRRLQPSLVGSHGI